MKKLSKIITFDYEDPSDPPKYPFGAKYLLFESDHGIFFFADALCKDHKTLLEKYKSFFDRFKSKPLGGGNLYFYGREKGFILREKSLGYGAADHEQTKKLLEEMFPLIPINIED